MFVSWSLLIGYKYFLGSFQIRFQFVMSSLDDHVRRIFQRMSAIFFIFLQFVVGTSSPDLV